MESRVLILDAGRVVADEPIAGLRSRLAEPSLSGVLRKVVAHEDVEQRAAALADAIAR